MRWAGRNDKKNGRRSSKMPKTLIQHAKDFYQWACNSNMKGVSFLFVSNEECSRMDESLKSRDVKAVKGNFKPHAVASAGNAAVFI